MNAMKPQHFTVGSFYLNNEWVPQGLTIMGIVTADNGETIYGVDIWYTKSGPDFHTHSCWKKDSLIPLVMADVTLPAESGHLGPMSDVVTKVEDANVDAVGRVNSTAGADRLSGPDASPQIPQDAKEKALKSSPVATGAGEVKPASEYCPTCKYQIQGSCTDPWHEGVR